MNEDQAVLKRIGKNIESLRKLRNLTQDEVAARAGLSLSRLKEILTAVRNPTATTLGRIARALEVELSELTASTPPGQEIGAARNSVVDSLVKRLEKIARELKRLRD